MNRFVEFLKENRDYFESYITRSTYHSNGIEGSTLSYVETYAIIFNDNSFQVEATPREIYEAINHKYAMDAVLKNVDAPLTETLIKNLGTLINKNINEVDGYRTGQVYIRGAEYVPPKPEEVPQAMMYFVHGMEHTEYENIFAKCAQMHIKFERIHPFSDGNGRTGRLLLNRELIRSGYAPIVIPKEKRKDYFVFLEQQDEKNLSKFFQKLEGNERKLLADFGFSFEEKNLKKEEVREENLKEKIKPKPLGL